MVRDALQLGDTIDVDDKARPRQPHRQQRHEGLAAGDDLAVLAGLGQRRADLAEAPGPHIIEIDGLHPLAAPAWPSWRESSAAASRTCCAFARKACSESRQTGAEMPMAPATWPVKSW